MPQLLSEKFEFYMITLSQNVYYKWIYIFKSNIVSFSVFP